MRQRNIVISMVVIAALVLVLLISGAQDKAFDEETTRDKQILVDGKVPPPLSNFPSHMAFIDDATCLRCHQNGKEMDFGGQKLVSPKIPHEFRENCVSCHQLPG